MLTVRAASNILDVPNFFWDSEPTLHPLYSAVREYLEIDRRTRVLNERCRVFLDLAEILSDAIADDKMSSITWTIIVLICISIVVTVTEVVLRFAIISGERNSLAPPAVIDPVQQAAVLQLVGSGSHPHVRPALPPGCVCPSIGAGLPGP